MFLLIMTWASWRWVVNISNVSRLTWWTVCGTATSTSTTGTCQRSLSTPPSRPRHRYPQIPRLFTHLLQTQKHLRNATIHCLCISLWVLQWIDFKDGQEVASLSHIRSVLVFKYLQLGNCSSTCLSFRWEALTLKPSKYEASMVRQWGPAIFIPLPYLKDWSSWATCANTTYRCLVEFFQHYLKYFLFYFLISTSCPRTRWQWRCQTKKPLPPTCQLRLPPQTTPPPKTVLVHLFTFSCLALPVCGYVECTSGTVWRVCTWVLATWPRPLSFSFCF